MTKSISDLPSHQERKRVRDALDRILAKFPDVAAKTEIVGDPNGGARLIDRKTKKPFGVVKSPSSDLFYWNRSNAMTEEQLAEKIKSQLKV
jgi:hypothetical protein